MVCVKATVADYLVMPHRPKHWRNGLQIAHYKWSALRHQRITLQKSTQHYYIRTRRYCRTTQPHQVPSTAHRTAPGPYREHDYLAHDGPSPGYSPTVRSTSGQRWNHTLTYSRQWDRTSRTRNDAHMSCHSVVTLEERVAKLRLDCSYVATHVQTSGLSRRVPRALPP